MRVREMEVGPELASKFLESNTHNRKVRETKVQEYARDMKAGRWLLTHECIAFSKNNVLVDGEHRLWAVVESGATVTFMVATEVDMETQAVIDGGLPRTMVDVMHLAYGESVDGLSIAIAKALVAGKTRGTLTRQEQHDAYTTHKPAITFATEAFPRKVRHVTTTPVLTVIARAWYTVDRGQLARFCEVLSTGKANHVDGEASVITLRNWLLEKAPTRGAVKMTVAAAVYGKTERALAAFLADENVSNLYAATSELFPLPIEKVKGGTVKAPKLVKSLKKGA